MIATALDRNPPFRPPPVEYDQRANTRLGFLRAMVRNPLAAFPPETYSQPVTFSDKTRKPVAFVCDPAVLDEILVRRPNDFPKSQVEERVLRPAFGNGLLSAQGEDWRWKRRLAAPHFSPAALAKLVPGMVVPFESLARKIVTRNENEPVNISAIMTKATLEVITETLFSSADELDMEAVSDAISDYLMPISWTISIASFGAPRWLPHPGKLRLERGRRRMRRLVAETVSRRGRSHHVYDDLCAELMAARDPESGKPLNDEDLVDMLLTLVSAGHETSANALTWALYCLASQPRHQQELKGEVEEVAGDGPIDAQHLPGLRKTEAFLKEAMRLFPPVPVMARRTAGQESIAGFSFSPNMTLFIPIYAIHRHQLLWESPDLFDPSRFLGERGKRISRTVYLPFGAGPRICIGGTFAMMEMTAALATMVRALSFGISRSTVCDPIQRVTLRPRASMFLDIGPAATGR